jgi:hypothetical protein
MNITILFRAFFLSLLLSFSILFSFHFFGKWEKIDIEMPEIGVSPYEKSSIVMESAIDEWSNTCLLFSDSHSTIVRDADKEEIKLTFSNIKFRKSFEFTIFDHFLLLILIAIALTIVLYFILNRRHFKKK